MLSRVIDVVCARTLTVGRSTIGLTGILNTRRTATGEPCTSLTKRRKTEVTVLLTNAAKLATGIRARRWITRVVVFNIDPLVPLAVVEAGVGWAAIVGV
jgi:hypothetical protein